MSPARGRPQTVPIKKLIAMDQDMLDGIEAFRADEDDKPNQSEAVRRIIRDWLVGHGYLKGS